MRHALLCALLVPAAAWAQSEVRPLTNGWSLHTRVGSIGSANAVACSHERAFVRDWSGTVAVFDGLHWSTLPRRQQSMYGRSIAASPDGQAFLESGNAIAQWDGTRWVDWPLDPWESDSDAGLTAPSATQVYRVGRGRIAILDGHQARVFAAGTWRSLSAVAVTGNELWVGGQGGTILHHGAGWAREQIGIETWVRSIVAFAPGDVWAVATSPVQNHSIVLHRDGNAWSRRDWPGDAIETIGGTADHVYATTSRAGLLRWTGTEWATELAPSDFGSDAQYYAPVGVCATDYHFIVGFGPHALVKPREARGR